ncbi:hypothetical protein GN157_17605 [Flavobacterium rakeshii]|uniref:Uncharacterized protein n=1 Tax=Flavobacterium rakeshii TaxID=1038845 RepID=A0A6N8HIE0_9FLAO|nr:hypothetical protein [Flavobacterium rakeshii]MUV05534.1 hypothetical protein [Flavobacterium rakeshii]
MTEEIKRNHKALSNIFALIFSITFGLSFIVIVLTGNLSLKALLYSAVATFAFALFVPVYLLLLFYIADKKEKRFFSKSPYNYIEQNLIEYSYDKKNRFSFCKKQHVFNHKGLKYTAVFYTNVYKTIYGDLLLIIKHEDNDTNIVSSIEYKKEKLSEKEFIEELENIKTDESRIVLRDI